MSPLSISKLSWLIADTGEAFTRSRHSATFGGEFSGVPSIPIAIRNVLRHSLFTGPADAHAEDFRSGRTRNTETSHLWTVADQKHRMWAAPLFCFFLEALLHSNFRAYFIVFFPDLPDILLETLANSVQEFYFGLLERTNQQILLKRKELNVSGMIYTFIFYILY